MIKESILELYHKFRLMSYKCLFNKVQEHDGSLSATEAFAADVIYLLDKPTITQFAEYIGISQPNATYKVNNLVEKGYVKKVPSVTDRREYRLEMSDKFVKYYTDYTEEFSCGLERIQEQFSPAELENFKKVLDAVVSIDF